ncbi:cell division protein ZapD [Thiocystis minor]|uniref:cell division protein ZapD n=1 Tax=Thiocystis minor TaxID=61597 RepID=UPI001912A3CF|nr:cell division protein ZapD [Thiocystis minor]
MSTSIIFEYPLNERIRTFLRLEHLFERLQHFADQFDPSATRVAIEALLEIAAITARSDIKNEILKELDRHLGTLSRLADKPGVDPNALAQVLGDLDDAVDGVQGMNSPIGQTAREDEFLKAIAQRSSIPGGTCSFDLPHYHYWLIQPPERRQARFDHWRHDLTPAIGAIQIALSLVRGSASPRRTLAEGGFFHEALNPEAPAQMLRVGLDASEASYPEISGHKNRFSIRFMAVESSGRPSQRSDDVSFKLTCCVL